MKPTIREVGFNPLMRSEEIMRYSGIYQAQPESLAVHICDTSMMAYIIGVQLNSFGEGLDLGLLLEKCLLHDLDETLTGDIPRNTKYANKEIKSALDNLQDDVLEVIKKYINNEEIIQKCKDAKKGKEGLILKLADMLGVARRALQEIVLRGNLTFLKVVEELGDHLEYLMNELNMEDFTQESSKWISELISDSKDTIREIHYSHIRDINDFSIMENVLRATPYQEGKKINGKKVKE